MDAPEADERNPLLAQVNVEELLVLGGTKGYRMTSEGASNEECVVLEGDLATGLYFAHDLPGLAGIFDGRQLSGKAAGLDCRGWQGSARRWLGAVGSGCTSSAMGRNRFGMPHEWI